MERPDELKEAVNLLKEFEKSDSHRIKTRTFSDAIDLLRDYVEESPDSSHLDFIENIRTSYTRILLQQLNSISQIEIEDWYNYFAPVSKVQSEVTKILSENPILKDGFTNFISIWKEEFLEFINQRANNK